MSISSAATNLSSDKNVFRLRGHLSRLTGQVKILGHLCTSDCRLPMAGLNNLQSPHSVGEGRQAGEQHQRRSAPGNIHFDGIGSFEC